MALPKKRKFSRRSVSKAVRHNLVCKKKNRSVGLQPELGQVTLKNYFFADLYLALLSALYAFSLPMLGGLNTYCVSYVLTYTLRPSTSLFFKGLSYFNFGLSLFIFSRSAVFIKNAHLLSDEHSSVASFRSYNMCGVPALRVFPHNLKLSAEPDKPAPTMEKSSSKYPTNVKSRVLAFASFLCRGLVKGQWGFLSTVKDYLSSTVKSDSGQGGSSGVVVGDVFKKFFIHTAFYKKTQWKTMFKYYYWTWDPLWMRYRYRIYWAKKAVHYRINQVIFEFFYLRMRAFQSLRHEPLSRRHCQKNIDWSPILSEAEALANYDRLRGIIRSRTLTSRFGVYLSKALFFRSRQIRAGASPLEFSKTTSFISLGISLSLADLVYFVVDRPVRLRTWKGGFAPKASVSPRSLGSVGQTSWYRRVLALVFKPSVKGASTSNLTTTSVRTNLYNWVSLGSRVSLFVTLVAGL